MEQPRLPNWIAAAVGILSLAAGVSGALGFVGSLSGGRWLFLGIEATLVVAGIFGILTALGRFRIGPALAILSVGGSVLVCGVLSEPNLVPWLMGQNVPPTRVLGIDLLIMAAARTAAGVVLVVLAALAAISRAPMQSLSLLLRAVALALPLVAAAALSRLPAASNLWGALPPPVQAVVAIMLLFIFGACLAVSVHCFIRGFEVTRRDAATP